MDIEHNARSPTGIGVRQSYFFLSFLVGALSLVIFLLIHPDVVKLFSSAYLGSASGDGGLYVWLAQSMYNNPLEALQLETNAFYPYPLSRAWSDSFLLPSACVAALQLLGIPMPVAYNTILVVAIALNGIATTHLALAVGLRRVFAVLGGFLFANSSYLIGNIGHPQLLFFFWIPWTWALVLSPSQVSRRRWFLAGACVAGAFYSSVYYAIFAALGLGIIWLHGFATDCVVTGKLSLGRLPRSALLVVCGALPILFTLPSYLAIQDFFGKRGLYEAAAFAASGLSYLAYSQHNYLFSGTARLTHDEATLSPGYLFLVLAILWGSRQLLRTSYPLGFILLGAIATVGYASSIVDAGTTSELVVCVSAWIVLGAAFGISVKRPTPAGALLLICVTCFVFSFGPGGNPIKHEPAFAPFGLIADYLPGLGAVRAVSRFGSIVILGVTILACGALQALLPARSRVAVLLSTAISAVVILESLVPGVPLDGVPPPPQAVTHLAQARGPGEAAIFLPFAGELEKGSVKRWSELANLSVRYALWSEPLGIPIVNGYSGQRSKLMYELPSATAQFPDARSFEYLARICGVRWVVIAPHLTSSWSQPAFDARLASDSSQIQETMRFSDGSILVKLADLPIPSSQELRPIIAPVRTPLHLTVTPEGNDSCTATVATLTRLGDGTLRSTPIEQRVLAGPTTITINDTTMRHAGAPLLLHVTTHGCTSFVTCSIP